MEILPSAGVDLNLLISVFPRKRLACNEECLGGLPCGRRGERGVLCHVSSEYVAQRRLLDWQCPRQTKKFFQENSGGTIFLSNCGWDFGGTSWSEILEFCDGNLEISSFLSTFQNPGLVMRVHELLGWSPQNPTCLYRGFYGKSPGFSKRWPKQPFIRPMGCRGAKMVGWSIFPRGKGQRGIHYRCPRSWKIERISLKVCWFYWKSR